jgi:hypothetical protein
VCVLCFSPLAGLSRGSHFYPLGFRDLLRDVAVPGLELSETRGWISICHGGRWRAVRILGSFLLRVLFSRLHRSDHYHRRHINALPCDAIDSENPLGREVCKAARLISRRLGGPPPSDLALDPAGPLAHVASKRATFSPYWIPTGMAWSFCPEFRNWPGRSGKKCPEPHDTCSKRAGFEPIRTEKTAPGAFSGSQSEQGSCAE